MAEIRQYCSFTLGDLLFGIEVEVVQEIIRSLEITRVPLSPQVVSGLINLRGQIVIAINLRRRLGLPDLESGRAPVNLVVRSGNELVSFLVDDIGDIQNVAEDSFEPPPDTLQGVGKELIQGVYKLNDRLLLVLDSKKALEAGSALAG